MPNWFKKKQPPPFDPWDLDCPVLFPDPGGEVWTMRDACGSLQVFGAPGSGKTSSIGKHLANRFLTMGFGGLVCCAKPGEAEIWQQWATKVGRANDLVIFNVASGHSFDLLKYELTRPSRGAGSTEEMAALLTKAMQAADSAETRRGGDENAAFFRNQMQVLVANAIDLCRLASDELSLELIDEVITDAPYSTDELSNPDIINERVTHQLILKWEHQQDIPAGLSDIERQDIQRAVNYFRSTLPAMHDKTRQSIVSTFSGPVDRLLRGEYRALFSSGKVTVPPEMSFDGKIIVLDFPVMERKVTGGMIQKLYKAVWQSAMRRRRVPQDARERGVFLWADESQFFAHKDDVDFLSVARESRAVTVYLTQSVSNYHREMRREDVNAILSNIATQTCLTTGDPETRKHFIDLIGGRTMYRVNSGEQQGKGDQKNSRSQGISQTVENQLKPQDFDTLRSGGPHNKNKVDMIFYQAGRTWLPRKRNYTLSTFQQF